MFFSLIRWLENQLHFPYFPLGRIHAWRPCLKPGKSEVGNRNTDAVCFGVQSFDLVIRLAINQLLLTGVLHRPKTERLLVITNLHPKIDMEHHATHIMAISCHIKMRKLIDPAKRWVRWVYVILCQHCHLWIACGSSFQPQKRTFVKQIQLKLPTQTIPVEPPWKRMVPQKNISSSSEPSSLVAPAALAWAGSKWTETAREPHLQSLF